MKVALVHRFFWRPGAVPAVVREWAGHLEAGGHEVAVFASDVRPAGPECQMPNARCQTIPDQTQGESAQERRTPTGSAGRRTYVPVGLGRGRLFDWAGLVFAARLFAALWRRRRPPPDLILAVDSTAYFGAWLAGRLLRVPAIMAFQGWIYSPGKRGVYPTTVAWLYRLSVAFCVRWAPMIGCLSREIYDGLRARGAPAGRLWFAPNCVDLALWRTPKEGAHRRAERRALFVGRFSPEKGLRYLLEAAPSVLARLPNVRFVLVGGDEGEDGEFHAMARRLGIMDRVDFCGVVPREALPMVYGDADVLAVPSLAEGHPLAPMEALACGTPVVGSDIPGLNETVADGSNGLLVPPRDPSALADALCRLLGDEALLDRLSRAARPSVERFAWEPRVRELAELLPRLR